MYILTRFNPIQKTLTIDINNGLYMARMNKLRFDDAWLMDRLQLFDHYTYPSVMSQTDQDFEWIGVVHTKTPEWFIKALESHDRIKLIKSDLDTDIRISKAMTINLDSDDALARNFIEVTRTEAAKEGASYFHSGMKVKVCTGAFITVPSGRNPFTIVGAMDNNETVFNHLHGNWPNPKIIKTTSPMWLQVIHDSNIANRFKKPRKTKPLDFKFIQKYFEISPLPSTIKLGKAI